ncbi:MAG: HpcH/HpaI aldolase/citrate lyase family protein [Candidatus Competibacter sp.]|nr:HpcH/HpaI aldolase/citrate lyase family protein [Candidatus Competibacter sp.]MDG4585502.1 HpcH/HpaI aldolase/citrate lyase family protein [Candidatus Competibacter sp.]
MSIIPLDACALHSGGQEHVRVEHAPLLSAALLGATLYVPASRPDLAAIARDHRRSGARSLIFCTEDAVHERDLERALAQLAALLPQLDPGPPLKFIRPRSPAVLRRLLRMEGIERVRGFAPPKFDPHTLGDWLKAWDDRYGHYLMPILETAAAFDRRRMELLRDRLEKSGLRDQVLCLRIGGNDLLNLLGVRRARDATVYDTPLRGVIADLACVFHPAGYRLSAPVFDRLDAPEVLAREVEADLQHGLAGKTAIHPTQIPVIEGCYRVSREDYDLAVAVLAPDAAAVFKLRETFCEPATHWRWAAAVLERARVFGVVD